MADVSTSTYQDKVVMYFVDGDTRTLNISNPTATSLQYADLEEWMQVNQPVIGDKNGAAFGKISSATRVSTEKTYIDIR